MSQVDKSPWRVAPLAPGAWHQLAGPEVAEMLERVPPLVLASAPFPLATFTAQMRSQPVACLRNWSVLETQISSGIGHCAVLRLLVDASNTLPLDGSGAPFHIVGQDDFLADRLSDPRAAVQYLRIYVGSIHSNGKAFHLCRAARDFAVMPGSSGSVTCRTHVQHDGQLFETLFAIAGDGDVRILNDHFVRRCARQRVGTLLGPWQVIGLH
jgi:hypothetical protein